MLKDVQKSALLSIFNREISKINKFPSQKPFFYNQISNLTW